MNIKYPKIKSDIKQRFYVVFYLNNKRYRLFNGQKINSNLYPNSYPVNKRYEIAQLLAAEVFKYISSGYKIQNTKNVVINSDLQYFSLALENKLKGDYSINYKSMLKYTYKGLKSHIKNSEISSNDIKSFLDQYHIGVSYNTIKKHLNVLINESRKIGMKGNPMEGIKAKKNKAKLHKPFKNIIPILNEIKSFNENLYICCLLTYGCLLRPHREIRELKWNDFSNDLNSIHLSGYRNKSGKNRIVPVPNYVRDQLKKGSGDDNIFTNNKKPLNKDYFKTLWTRYRKVSKLLEQDQTLYSFRHSGAIDIFKRTGSLQKLQAAMGHSSLLITTTYLRGLEVCELNKEDMPVL